MKTPRTLVSQILIGTVSGLLFASVSHADPDIIKAIAEKYQKQHQAIQDTTIRQVTKAVTPQGTFSQKSQIFKKGDKFRVQTQMDTAGMPNMPPGMAGMETTIIRDGKTTWVISPFAGKMAMPESQDTEHKQYSDFAELINTNSKIVGADNVAGRECWVLEIQDKKGQPYRLWVDQKEMMLVKGEMSEPRTGTATWVHSDFRKVVGGYEMPFKTEMYLNGSLMATSLTESIEINKNLSDDLFDPNKVKTQGPDIQAMMQQAMQQQKGQ